MVSMLLLAAIAASILMITADSDVAIIRTIQAIVFAGILTLLATGIAIAVVT
jgi:hypothetical protein